MRSAFCLLLVSLLADIAAAAAPPLKPGEEIVKTADGCGIVIRSDQAADVHVRKFYSQNAWGGACVDGLAMGEGIFSPRLMRHDGVYQEETRGWAWYGRPFGWGEMRHSNGAVLQSFGWEGKGVYYQSLDPAAVTWSTATALGSNISDGDTTVWADAVRFQVSVAKDGKSESFRCPTPGSYAGCDAVWTAHAAPVIERIKVFIAMNEPKVEKRRNEAEALAAKWQQQVGPEEVASRAVLAQRINAQVTLRGENHKRCWDTDQSIQTEYVKWSSAKRRSPKQEADREEQLGHAYQELWSKPECATHSYALDGLKKADMYFGFAAKSRGLQEEWARRSSERTAKMFGAIAEGVTTFQNTQNALQQQQAPPSQPPAQNAPPAPQVSPSPSQRNGSGAADTYRPNPANIRYGCVARGVKTMPDGRVLDTFDNRCGETLSWAWYRKGYWESRVMTVRDTHYLDHNTYANLTICVAGRLKWEGSQAWCY